MQAYLNLASPSRLGLLTAMAACCAVLLLCGVFQLVVPMQDVPTTTPYLGTANINLRSLILYATAGGSHVLISVVGTVFLMSQIRAEEPRSEYSKIILHMTLAFLIISSILLVACYLGLSVVHHSYSDTVRPLRSDPRFGGLLKESRLPLFNMAFEFFAFLPFLLVLFGVAFSIAACFWIAHRAVGYVRIADDLKKADIKAIRRAITLLVSLMAIVFIASTIATIAFLQIGRDWITKGEWKDAYIQNGFAMSIFWAACFTAIFLAVLLIPLFWAAKQTARLRRQAKYSGGETGYYDQFIEAISFKFVVQSGAAILAPLSK